MISKLDLSISDLIYFALKEYGNSTLHKRELMECGHIRKSFGCLIADISVVIAEKNKLYLRKYNVKSVNGDFSASFILGHAAMLFGVSSRKFREELLNTESIKGVITLKQSVFEQIVMPAAVIVLNSNDSETWFTSAENVETLIALLKGNTENAQSVYYSSNVSPENLLPEFYNGDDKIIEKSFEGSQTKKLEEIAEIISGKGAKRDDFSADGIPYMRARDIQDGQIIQPDVFIDEEKVSAFSRQLIQEGDILLTKFFGQNKLALVTEVDIPAIASNGLFIIRPFDISEGYLFNYLTSKTGNEIFNKQLNRVQKGVTIPSITLADLKKIVVPIFEQDVMHSIENIDSISRNEAIVTAKKLMNQINSETELELKVKDNLLAAGWEESKFVVNTNAAIAFGNNKRWIPDYTYIMPDGRKAIIEIKADIAHIRPEWIQAVKYILSEENDYIFILSTGMYYEIHFSGVPQSLKLMQAPTIEQLLDWEKEVR